ncbi:MAG TPA: hypothetical protein V6D07_17275 [Trichocoleus sp.]
MSSKLTLALVENAAVRFDQVMTELLETWGWPCECTSPGRLQQCLSCPGFRQLVEDMQQRLAANLEDDLVELAPLVLKPPYSDKVRQDCLLLYKRGANLSTIQRVTGVTNRKVLRAWLVEAELLSRSICDCKHQQQRCLELYQQGLTPSEIEDRTRVHADVISHWAGEAGISRPKNHLTDAQKEAIPQLFYENLSFAKIGRCIDANPHQVKQWAREAGLKRKRIYGGARPPVYSESDKQECLLLLQEGYTTQQIEELTDISANTLLEWFKEFCLHLLQEGRTPTEVEALTGVGFRVLPRWWRTVVNPEAPQ